MAALTTNTINLGTTIHNPAISLSIIDPFYNFAQLQQRSALLAWTLFPG